MRTTRGSWILAGLVYAFSFFLFPLRTELLNACWGRPGDGSACDAPVVIPDARHGYGASELWTWLAPAGPDGRRFYAWSAVTLDLVFPMLYASLLALLLWRAWPRSSAAVTASPAPAAWRLRAWRAFALLGPLTMAAADWVENWKLFQAARLPVFGPGQPGWGEFERLAQAAATAGTLKFAALSMLVVALGAATLAQRLGPLLNLLWLSRVPLAGLGTLLLLPSLGGGEQVSPSVANLFVMEKPAHLFFVAFSACYCAALAGFSLALVWELGPARSGATLPPRPAALRRLPSGSAHQGRYFVLCALPLVFLCGLRSALERQTHQGHPGEAQAGLSTLGAVGAALLGIGCCWLFLEVVERLRRPLARWQRPLPPRLGAWLRARLGAGYYERDATTLLPGHALAASGLLLLSVVYALGQFALAPDVAWPGSAALPTLAYLLVALTIVVSLFSGAAFYFDRWRVPLLAIAIGWWALLGLGGPVRHAFHARWVAAPLPQVKELLATRLAAQPRAPYVAVVTASGGGIQAAAWTTRALAGLTRLDAQFPRRIGVLSSVSGGSVGAYLFLSALDPQGLLDPRQADALIAAGDASGLEQTTWGLLFPDLQRGLRPWVDPFRDRGWALEQAWQARAVELGASPQAGLSSWVERARAGTLPAVVFSAIRVDDGFPLRLANVDGPADGQLGGRYRYSRLPDERGYLELPASTAARLSATFPYVSPLARPCEPLRGSGRCADGLLPWRAADGGYLDNHGTLAALAWLEAAFAGEPAALPRVVWIHVDGFPRAKPDSGRVDATPGWLVSLLGPPSALLRVRTAGQDVRHALEMQLAARFRGLETVTLRPPREYAREAPLSWQLGRLDRERLDADWAQVERGEEFARLRELLRGAATTPAR